MSERQHIYKTRRTVRNKVMFRRLLSAVMIILAVVVFVLNLLTPDRTFSDKENRTLAGRPELSRETLADWSYPGDLTSWYQDQFFGRDRWMSLKFRTEYALGQREFNGIYTGKDGYLLAKPEEPDPEALQRTAEAVKGFAERYPQTGIDMLVVQDAASVLADKLPGGVTARDQAADIREFYQMLPEQTGKIDVAETLRSDTQEQIYYRTDHHWTSAGALAAFGAARQELQIPADGVTYTPYLVSDRFQGTLASRSGDLRQRDRIQVYDPVGTDVIYVVNYPDEQKRSRSMFRSEMLEQKDQYTVFFGGNHALVEINTTTENGRNLLVFKDSYANSFMQFLTPYYQSIIMVDPRYYYGDIGTVMNTYGITDVLFLYSADTLFTDTALADTLGAGTGTGE